MGHLACRDPPALSGDADLTVGKGRPGLGNALQTVGRIASNRALLARACPVPAES